MADVPHGSEVSSPDGRLKDFKPGAFLFAQRVRVPILPIVVEGSSRALPKRGFVLPKGRHAIRVLDEIPAERFASLTVDELSASVRERFLAELGQADQPRRVASSG